MSASARPWLVLTGVLLLVVQASFALLWWKLPVWAPVWVAEHSPWHQPVLRALLINDGGEGAEVARLVTGRLIRLQADAQGLLPRWFAQADQEGRQEIVSLGVSLMDGSAEDLAPEALVRQARGFLHEDLVVLADASFTEPSPETQRLGFLLTERLGDRRLTPGICRVLEHSTTTLPSYTHDWLLQALRALGDRRAVPALLAHYSRMRSAVDGFAIDACLPVDAWEEPVAALASTDSHLRSWGLDRLAGVGDLRGDAAKEQAVTRAVVTALDDPHPSVRLAAIAAVQGLRLSTAGAALTRLLRDEHALTRAWAADALRLLGDASVLPALLPLLDDPDPIVRIAAADALGGFSDGRVAEGLLRLTGDREPAVACAAVEALERLPLSPAQSHRLAIAAGALLPPGRRHGSAGGWR